MTVKVLGASTMRTRRGRTRSVQVSGPSTFPSLTVIVSSPRPPQARGTCPSSQGGRGRDCWRGPLEARSVEAVAREEGSVILQTQRCRTSEAIKSGGELLLRITSGSFLACRGHKVFAQAVGCNLRRGTDGAISCLDLASEREDRGVHLVNRHRRVAEQRLVAG